MVAEKTYQSGVKSYSSKEELSDRSEIATLLHDTPIPDVELLENLGLYLEPKTLSRILFIDFLFRKIRETQGVVIEFGTRWGQNVSLFSVLRGIYEPFNRHRKIIGFDTFKGFAQTSKKDGRTRMMKEGVFGVSPGYEKYLARILELHEGLSPLSHLKKFELCKGDATYEVGKYMKRNPETIVALAYFDLDLYTPTKRCLEVILPRLTKGSVVALDELNEHDTPGETLALLETVGLAKIRLKRYPYATRVSYFVVE